LIRMNQRKFQLFSGSSAANLVEGIAQVFEGDLGVPGIMPGEVEIQRFSDGEFQPIFKESLRGNDVYLVQSTYAPSDNLMELLLMMDAARRASANSVTAVIPYFGYARQDRKDRPRVSIGAKLVANLLEAAGCDRVVTMDLHAGQIQGFFDIPVDNLEASMVFVPYIKDLGLDNLVIASPDMGGAPRARHYAKQLDADLVLVDKMRERANQVAKMSLIGDVEGKHVVIVDDIVDTGGTLTLAAEYMLDKGALSVRAAIAHPILSGPAHDRIQKSKLTELLVTNTIPLKQPNDRIKVLGIERIFATALHNIHNFGSVSSLFPK
jgi:ribose-phosphate pyrophosphokinase